MKKRKMAWLLLMLCMILAVMPANASAAAKISRKKLTLMVGQEYTLRMKNTKRKVRWTSSSYVKAPVSTNGRVVARKRGIVKITAQIGKKRYTCRLTIKQPVTDIRLSQTECLLKKGKSVRLSAEVAPANANTKLLKWASEDPKIATVNSKGRVKAKANGTVLITATAADGSGASAVCKVTVNETGTLVAEETPAAEIKTPSPRALSLLTILQGFSNQVKADKEKGIVWVYDYSYENHGSFEKETKRKATTLRKTNCAMFVRWGLRALGVMSDEQSMWGFWEPETSTAGFYFNKLYTAEEIDQTFERIVADKTPAQLEAEGNLLPGDICCWNGMMHTNVYAGNQLWYDSGRFSGKVGHYDTVKKKEYFVMDTFGPAATVAMVPYSGATIHEILRLR